MGGAVVTILRKDQQRLKTAFAGWEIYNTNAPGLRYWDGEAFLEKIPNVWLRKDRESPWALEVMFQNSRDGQWIYRRNEAIQRKIDDIGFITRDGIPYLRPEIQLLYKGGGSLYRETDLDDLKSILPVLSDDSKQWLISALQTEFPDGHDWIDILIKSCK